MKACQPDPQEGRYDRQPLGAKQSLSASLTKKLKAGHEVCRDTGGYKVGEGVFVKVLATGHHLQRAGRQGVRSS